MLLFGQQKKPDKFGTAKSAGQFTLLKVLKILTERDLIRLLWRQNFSGMDEGLLAKNGGSDRPGEEVPVGISDNKFRNNG